MTTPLLPTIQPDALRVAAPTVPQAPQEPTKLTPYQAFLYRQALRITARGGSLGDVADYLQHAEDHNIKASVEPPRSDAEAPGMVRGLSQQALQGVTFGFGDEALGTLYGLLSGEGGQAGRDLYRAELSMFQAQHPKTALAAQIGGALGVPIGLGLRAAGTGGKLAAAGIGAGAAALAGAGNAEGGLTERAKQALYAAPFGAAVGAVAPFAGQLVGKGAAALGRGAQILATKVAPGLEKQFKAIIEHLPGSPARAARRALADAMGRDGIGVAAAADKAEQRAALGLPSTVADIGGDHVLALAQTAQQFRTPAQQLLVARLMERQADQGARLLGAIGTGSRLGLQNAYELGDQLIAQRIARAAPLYQDAFAQQVPLTSGLRKLLNTPLFREAYVTGRATALAEDAAQLRRGIKVPELPDDIRDIAQLPVRGFDYMKRGLDHMIERAGQEGRPPLSRQTAAALRQQLNKALDEVGAKVPSYQQARDVWRGFSEQIDALQAGREGFLTKAPEQIAKEIAASPAPAMYRIGAIQALADGVHGVGAENADLARRFFGARLFGVQDRTMAARMRTLFDSQSAAEDFMDRLAGEASSTQALKRLGRAGRPNPDIATQQLAPPGMTARLTEKAGISTASARTDRARAVANEITMLFTKGLDDPNELVAMLRGLDGLERSAEVGAAALRIAGGQLGARVER